MKKETSSKFGSILKTQGEFYKRQTNDKQQNLEEMDHILTGRQGFVYDKDKIALNEALQDFDN